MKFVFSENHLQILFILIIASRIYKDKWLLLVNPYHWYILMKFLFVAIHQTDSVLFSLWRNIGIYHVLIESFRKWLLKSKYLCRSYFFKMVIIKIYALVYYIFWIWNLTVVEISSAWLLRASNSLYSWTRLIMNYNLRLSCSPISVLFKCNWGTWNIAVISMYMYISSFQSCFILTDMFLKPD